MWGNAAVTQAYLSSRRSSATSTSSCATAGHGVHERGHRALSRDGGRRGRRGPQLTPPGRARSREARRSGAHRGAGAGRARRYAGPLRFLPATPYMGWNTYYGVGGSFDQKTIISVAESLLHTGLARAGYRIVWLDFGWASGGATDGGSIDRRAAASGRMGCAWLTAWLHAHGLLAGIYTDAGASGCQQGASARSATTSRTSTPSPPGGSTPSRSTSAAPARRACGRRPLYQRVRHGDGEQLEPPLMILNVCNFWVPGTDRRHSGRRSPTRPATTRRGRRRSRRAGAPTPTSAPPGTSCSSTSCATSTRRRRPPGRRSRPMERP